MRTLLMQLDGVLAETRSESLVENSPIPQGMMLWHSLRSDFEIIVYSEHVHDRIQFWLQRENVKGVLDIFAETRGDKLQEVITKSRFDGHDLVMLITADPTHVVAAYREGLQALLFVHPSYGRPEWRPDYEQTPRPWDEMVEEVVQKRVALGADARTIGTNEKVSSEDAGN